MNIFDLKNIRFILILLAVYSLVACNKKENISINTPQTLPTANTNQIPTQSQGTSDSGGGNGIDGKVYESYIVDPTQLAAYQNVLKIPVENMGISLNQNRDLEPGETKESLTSESKKVFPFFFKTKTWYIAPVELNKINKDVLGISFQNSETEQLAIQTKNEIWIDKSKFDKMSTQEQAELIFHELVMTVYLFKYIPYSEMCHWNFISDKKMNCKDSKVIDEWMPVPELKPLDKNDYENIRFVTGWLMKNKDRQLSNSELISLLSAKGFDQRIFHQNKKNKKAKEVPSKDVTSIQIFNSIISAQVTNKIPSTCFNLDSGQDENCKIQFEKTKDTFSHTPVDAIKMTFVDSNEHSSVSRLFIPSKSNMASISGFNDDEPRYLFSAGEIKDHFEVGDSAKTIFFLVKTLKNYAGEEELILDKIVVIPSIVTSISPERSNICSVDTPQAENTLSSLIITRHSDEKLDYWIKSFARMLKPFAMCTKENTASH